MNYHQRPSYSQHKPEVLNQNTNYISKIVFMREEKITFAEID
jgi:hypothetical protein